MNADIKPFHSRFISRFIILLIAIVMIGVFFRVTHLDQKVYWHDEVFTSVRASGYTAEEIIPQVFSGDPVSSEALLQYQQLSAARGWNATWQALKSNPEHSPLYYLAVRLWMEWFGSAVASVRSLSVVLSLLTLPALYWLSRELFDRPYAHPNAPSWKPSLVSWVVILLWSVSPFHVLYAQEARQSSLWTLATVLSSAALLRSLRLQTRTSWLIYAATVALNLYTFLLSVLVLACHGLVVLGMRPFSWRSVQRFTVALLVGLLAFTPWITVMINNWATLQSKTAWTTQSPPLSVLAKLWGLHFSSDFIDLGLPLDHPYTYLVPPLVLALVGTSLWVLCRQTPRRIWLPIVLLIGLPALALILPDIVLGGQRSLNTRYFVPSLIGALLAVAYLVSAWMQHPAAMQRQLGRGLLTVLLTVGIVSCTVSWQANAWWSKGVSYYNPTVAAFLRQFNQPTIVSSLAPDTLGNVISLSREVDRRHHSIWFQLVIDPAIPTRWLAGDRFLYYPTEALRQNLQATGSVQLVPVAPPTIPLVKLVDSQLTPNPES
jgi:uncharacterized membrane protein